MKLNIAFIFKIIPLLAFLFLSVHVMPVYAVEGLKPKLDLKTIAEKEIVRIAGGKESVERIPAKDSQSGDVIVYTVNYKNNGQTDAKDAFITDPIPPGTCYIDGSASTEGVLLAFSLDSGNTYQRPPVMIKKKGADGKDSEVPAPPASFTHIRWTFPKALVSGQSGELTFKVKVY